MYPPQRRVRDESLSSRAGLSGPETETILAPMPNVWACAPRAAPPSTARASAATTTDRQFTILTGSSFGGTWAAVLPFLDYRWNGESR